MNSRRIGLVASALGRIIDSTLKGNLGAISSWHEEIAGGLVPHDAVLGEISSKFPGVKVEQVPDKQNIIVLGAEARFMLEQSAFKICVISQDVLFRNGYRKSKRTRFFLRLMPHYPNFGTKTRGNDAVNALVEDVSPVDTVQAVKPADLVHVLPVSLAGSVGNTREKDVTELKQRAARQAEDRDRIESEIAMAEMKMRELEEERVEALLSAKKTLASKKETLQQLTDAKIVPQRRAGWKKRKRCDEQVHTKAREKCPSFLMNAFGSR